VSGRIERSSEHRVFHLLVCFVAFSALTVTGKIFAQAGGLALPEDGGPINGTAQAGSAAVARDAQTAWLNPAGMTRLETPELLFTFQPFLLNFEFDIDPLTTTSGTDGGDQGRWLPSGAIYFAAPLWEGKAAVGFSLTSPAGLVLDPDSDWVGRYFMNRTALIALNLEPSFAFRFNEQWSIGAGIDVQYARFEQDISVNLPGPLPDAQATIDGDSWDVGFSVSLLWEPLDTTRVGIRYRSKMNHSLSGDLTAFGSTSVSTGLDIPQSVTLSAYHDFSPTFALMADVGWQEWSDFDETIISIDGLDGVQAELPRNFKDTWTFSLGAHIRPAERWLVMCGAGYTSSAVNDSNRTPDMPVDQQVRASVGLEYEINDSWRVGGNYTFLWMGDNNIDVSLNPSTGRVVGDYDAFAHLFGFYASVRF